MRIVTMLPTLPPPTVPSLTLTLMTSWWILVLDEHRLYIITTWHL
jgi:hypothetical protein